MIALEQVSLALEEFHLNEVDLRISAGEFLVIIGPSGAGKTVLLETIAGLRSPDRGRILIGGADAGGVLPEDRHIALVYQDYSLFPHMTASENIAFGLKLRHIPVKEIDRRVRSLLTQFNILHCSDHYPSSMSGGEQQRVAIARALATDPSVLLLDEPFASLDPRSRDECIRVMQDLRGSHSVTIIQVSHSGDEAFALADRVAVLLNGRIAQTGTPDEVFGQPASAEVARFVGMENILTGTVGDTGAGCSRLIAGRGTVLIPAKYPQGARISIGIPAGSVRLVPGDEVPGGPCENHIPCVVRRVTLGKETVTLSLEGAIAITAIVLRTAAGGEIPPRVQR